MAAPKKAAELPKDQPGAIDERGEHELRLAGVTYRLRPSHAALRSIEKKTDRSVLRLVQLGRACDLTLEQLGIIGCELIRAGAEDELTRRVDAERIGELIQEEGVMGPTARFTLCLYDAATGGRTATGEAKAAAA